MTTEKMYRYLGRNGTITSPILLENIAPIPMKRLMASSGKILTNGKRTTKEAIVFEDEVTEWEEIDEAKSE